MNTAIWVVNANGSRATIYRAQSPTGALEQLQELENPDARHKQSDLLSDRAGRAFDSHGVARHALAKEVDPREHEQIRFAKEITERLEQGRSGNSFHHVVLIAAPAFLGLLRTHLTNPLRALVTLELDKDLTALDAEQLRARLPQRI